MEEAKRMCKEKLRQMSKETLIDMIVDNFMADEDIIETAFAKKLFKNP